MADRLGHDRVLTAIADARDPGAMAAAAHQGIERFGGIDVVVANAGVGSFGSVLNIDPAAFKKVIDINLTGVFNSCCGVHRSGFLLGLPAGR